MKKAIATLILGKNYVDKWKSFSENNWTSYAKKYGFELVIFDKPLDNSKRALSRSAAWQKCLILDQLSIKKFDKVVWMDSDIVINAATAPDIVTEVPDTYIGASDAFSFYTKELYSSLFEIFEKYCSLNNLNIIADRSSNNYYTNYGIKTDLSDVLQTGVMVLTPRLHNEVLKYVYYTYEDKGGPEWHYEMRPLSYEIVKNEKYYFIDHRFNYLFNYFKLAFYPHLQNLKLSLFIRVLGKLGFINSKGELTTAMSAAYLNSYFLHFAGCSHEMAFLRLPSQFD